MRITTSQFYDRSIGQLSMLNGQADKLQSQIATGKRLTEAADDTIAYQRLAGIKRAAADDTAYTSNISFAQSLLDQADTTLSSITTQLQRANEYAVQAANGTLSSSDRESIAVSLDSILDDLLTLSNTKDARGQPLFGGTSGETAFSRAPDGTISYVGAGDTATIPIGPDTDIQVGTDGAQVFGGNGATPDMFATIKGLADALRSGGDTSSAMDDIQASLHKITTAQASIGARGARLDLEKSRLADVAVSREVTRSDLEDTDVTTAIAQLQQTLTALQATQASFTKLEGLTLFDYLR